MENQKFSPAFEHALNFILRPDIEGGYVNDPTDSGGETKYGISDRRDGVIDGKTDVNGDGKPDIRGDLDGWRTGADDGSGAGSA